MALDIITAADVINRIGGTAQLIQLLPDGTDPSTYDVARLSALRSDAAEEVASRANVQVQVYAWKEAIAADPSLVWPPYLVDIVSWLCVGKVWDAGTSGQAKPENVAAWQARVMDVECEKLRRNEISLGAPPSYPVLQPNVQTIDLDPNNNRMTLASFQQWIA